jgi:hypothetical protein
LARECSPPAWRSRATAEQKREGWEMAVRIEKIIATVLDEAQLRMMRASYSYSVLPLESGELLRG